MGVPGGHSNLLGMYWLLLFFLNMSLGMDTRAFRMLSVPCTTELHLRLRMHLFVDYLF